MTGSCHRLQSGGYTGVTPLFGALHNEIAEGSSSKTRKWQKCCLGNGKSVVYNIFFVVGILFLWYKNRYKVTLE